MTNQEPTATTPPLDGDGPPVATSLAEPPAPPPPTGPHRRRASLREVFVSFEQPDFRYLGLSTLALGFGQWAQQIGLAWLVYVLTGSATQLGAIAAFRGGVGTITAPIGGVLADRYSRRVVLIWSTAASAAQGVVFAVLIVTGLLELWHVYVLAFAGGVIQSISQPARQAFVYDVSTDENLPNAIAMNSMVQNVSRVSGPPLTGAMIAAFGTGAPFMFLAATQVVAMGLTLMISQNTRQERVSPSNPFRQIVEGFQFTWRDRRVLGLVVAATIPALLVYPYLPFLSVVAQELGRGPRGYGLMASMVGWGSLLGLFLLALFPDPPRKGRLMLGCFILYASFLFLFAQSHVYLLCLAALAGAGIFNSVAMVLNNTLIQLAVRNDIRGRVMSVWQVSGGLQPLGSLPMGILVTRYGPQIGIGSFMATAVIIFVLFAAGWGSVRRM
jgi:predicted MFS family arabinose efflux permease